MPFNIADTLKQSLAIPLQQGVALAVNTVAATVEAGVNVASNAISNFSVASGSKKAAEAVNKIVGQGSTEQFNKVTQQLSMIAENGKTVLKDATTNRALATIGDTKEASFASEFLQGDVTPDMSQLKVTLTQEPLGYMSVVFDAMPTISESRGVQYDSFTPLHHPGEILKYKGTSGREWGINARLISRNVEEATWNLAMINTIRAWSMPYYGEGTARSDPTLLGAPPPILTLSAYGTSMIGPVKCVITNSSWDWPNDVDFLPAVDQTTGENRPFPVILSVQLSLKEAWSPAEFSGFSIRDYQFGDLTRSFSAINRTVFNPQTTVSPATDPTALQRSEPVNLNQGGVNNASSNLASNVSGGGTWGREVRSAVGNNSATTPNSPSSAGSSSLISGGGGNFGGGGASSGF